MPAEELAPRSIYEPSPERVPLDHPQRDAIIAAHRAAVDAGEPGYLDPLTGLFVTAATEFIRRGRCCVNDCRHCPYF